MLTSDNGVLWGEHRCESKNVPYEESIAVPLIVRYDAMVPTSRATRSYDLRRDPWERENHYESKALSDVRTAMNDKLVDACQPRTPGLVLDGAYLHEAAVRRGGVSWAGVRTNLTLHDIGGLLDEPIVAVLATLRPDGSVLLSPVWHEWRDGGFNLWLSADDVKSRHLRRDPRATIVVAESADPLRGVELRTEARLLPAEDLSDAIRIATRYVGPEKGAEYVQGAEYDSVIARLEPGHLRIWDFADE